MKIVFLGTASCFPTPNRGVSCTAIQWDDGNVWLFDCGEGSQIQLQKSCIKPGKVTKIFITHLHGDHCFGLPGLLCTLGNNATTQKTVDIYGPLGLRKYISTVLELSRSPLPYTYNVHELVPQESQYPEDWVRWPVDLEREYPQPLESKTSKIEAEESGVWRLISGEDEDKCGIKVTAGAIKHRVPSFGFVMKEADQVGSLDVTKCKQMGLPPGPRYAELKKGKTIQLEDGTVVKPEDVTGPMKAGRKIIILGDTCDTTGIESQCLEADLLIHEATMEDGLREKAIEYGHSTPSMASGMAVRINAKRLCLTHLSPRYKPISNEVEEVIEKKAKKEEEEYSAQTLLDEARRFMEKSEKPNIDLHIADDFYEIIL